MACFARNVLPSHGPSFVKVIYVGWTGESFPAIAFSLDFFLHNVVFPNSYMLMHGENNDQSHA